MKKLFYIKQIVKYCTLFFLVINILNSCIFEIKEIKHYSLVFFVISMILFVILECLTFGFVASPNNKIKNIISVNEKYIFYEQLEIEIYELEKGVWQIIDNKKNIILDMKGWLNPHKYIHMLIVTELILKKYNEEKSIAYSLPYGKQTSKIKNLNLVFVNRKGKKIKKEVIKDKNIRKSIYIRYRLRMSLNMPRSTDPKNYQYYEIKLSDVFKIS